MFTDNVFSRQGKAKLLNQTKMWYRHSSLPRDELQFLQMTNGVTLGDQKICLSVILEQQQSIFLLDLEDL